MSVYITEGLERARDGLSEAAALRERFVLGTSVSRRVAAAAASAVISYIALSHYFICSLFQLLGGVTYNFYDYFSGRSCCCCW